LSIPLNFSLREMIGFSKIADFTNAYDLSAT